MVFLTVVLAVVFVAWGAGDFGFFPNHARDFMYYRLAASATCAALALLAWHLRTANAKYAAMWLWFMVWGGANAAMIPATPQHLLSHVFVLVIAQFGSSAFMFWNWKWGFTKSLALLAVGEAAIGHAGAEGYDAFAAHAYLVTGVVLNVAFQKVRYDAALREYLTRRELADANKQLQEVDVMRRTFFANISHELRTPLTLILSPVEELLSKLQPSIERDALLVVRRNATRLLRMIDDLLDLARLEAGGLRLKVMKLDLDSVARRTVENVQPTAKASGVELRYRCNAEPEAIFGDPHRVEIILTNLVGNAMKFTPSGGRITVTCSHSVEGAVVEVSDTGPGVPRAEQERIFDRFHQAENSETRKHGGVGIGLALARELAELHGGSLTVESEFGRGSTFRLSLKAGKEHFDEAVVERRSIQVANHPGRRVEDGLTQLPRSAELATLETRDNQSPEGRVLLDRGRVPRVLVTEDEDDLRDFVVAVLSSIYEVDVAKNGAEALASIEKARPDLVLTDVMMPEVSGLDLCRSIKGDPTLQHIPVILLTARGESEAALEGYEAGADDFVSKPFHTKVLLARIRAHLKMRGLSLQLADQARLASAGTLAAGLAHEVKNPLNAILSAALVLEKGGSGRVPSEKLMRLIVDGIRRIDDIISALDAHARPADGMDLAPCDVREGIESTLALLGHKMRHIAVHRDFQVTGTVFAPARAFNQILLNLVDNAARSGAKNVWVELSQANGRVKVAVADDGPGVPPDMVSRIFDPFFTTRAEGEGTGLGLHLSRRIAHECGGELRYERRGGGGARFVMEVPAMEKAA